MLKVIRTDDKHYRSVMLRYTIASLSYECPLDEEGFRHGTAKQYDHGKITQTTDFCHDEPHGWFRRFNGKGEIIEEFQYDHGLINGLYTCKNGKKAIVCLYRDNEVILQGQPGLSIDDIMKWARAYIRSNRPSK